MVKHLDWDRIYDFFYQQPDRTLLIKTNGAAIARPQWLHETIFGFLEGSKKQYRDNKEYDSLHVREYSGYITIHIDSANPELHPIEHAIMDFEKISSTSTFKTIAVGVVGVFLLGFFLKKLSA